MASHLNNLRREIDGAGWLLVRQKRHQVYACPCGRHRMILPTTPGEGRATANARALFTRLNRECATTRQEIPA